MKSQNVDTHLKSEKLGKYYIDMKNDVRRSSNPIYKTDKEGVLKYKIPYTNNFDYYPVFIAGYALGCFDFYIDTNKEEYADVFMRQSEWLLNNITIQKENMGVWQHWYNLPYFNHYKIPWVHGMAQGLAISVLLRAYQLTNDKIYLETAKKAYGAFERDIEEGGVKYIDENGDIWLEEYAILPPPHILNGFIFALFGIYDFYRVTKSEKALKLWNICIKTLERNLPLYDRGYWSTYDLLRKYPATRSYHNLHIKQLKILYKLTGKEFFNTYAKRWNKYLDNPIYGIMANLSRGKVHVKRYGIKECIRRYYQRVEWLKVR